MKTVWQRGNSWAAQVKVKDRPVKNNSFPIPGKKKHTAEDRKATKKIAEAWAEATERDEMKFEENGDTPEQTDLLLSQLVTAYLEEPDTAALKSVHDNEQRLGFWLEHYGKKTVTEFHRQRLMRKGRALLATKINTDQIKRSTANRYIRAMSAAWNFGIGQESIPDGMAWPKMNMMFSEPDARDRHLNADERAALLSKARDTDPEMYVLILTALATGIRQDNLITLQWKQVDFAGKKITLPKTKNGKPHQVLLPDSAAAALKMLEAGRETKKGTVFLNFEGMPFKQSVLIRRFKLLVKAAELPTEGDDKVTFHTLRHTTASMLGQNGASLPEIGAVLGHRSQNSTAKYLHFTKAAEVTGHAALDKLLTPTSTQTA